MISVTLKSFAAGPTAAAAAAASVPLATFSAFG